MATPTALNKIPAYQECDALARLALAWISVLVRAFVTMTVLAWPKRFHPLFERLEQIAS